MTPTIELAKLALVTSQDEEEEDQDQDRTGTDSSNDTDATLVDDAPPRLSSSFDRSPGSPDLGSSATVLGKRHRDLRSEMDVDNPSGVSSARDATSTVSLPPLSEPQAVASSSKLGSTDRNDDAPMTDVSADIHVSSHAEGPSLSSRKSRHLDDSVMMFGLYILMSYLLFLFNPDCYLW